MEKRLRGSNIICSIILRLWPGKNIKWGKGEGDGNFGEENQDLIKWGCEEIKVVGNFIHPCSYHLSDFRIWR